MQIWWWWCCWSQFPCQNSWEEIQQHACLWIHFQSKNLNLRNDSRNNQRYFVENLGCWLIFKDKQSKDIVIVKTEYDCITKKPFSFEIRICSFPSSFVCLLEIVNCFLKWISEIGKWRKFSSFAAPHQIKSYCSKREREGKIFRR